MFAVSVCWYGSAAAQEVSAPRDDVAAFRDTLAVDGPQPFVLRSFLLPGTLTVVADGRVLEDSLVRVDERYGRLWVEEAVLDTTETLVATYRTWGAFRDTYRRRTLVTRDDGPDTTAVAGEEDGAPDAFDPFEGVRLQRSGSISRGILAGNNRDVTVESGLRMQLSGEVAEGVDVEAVLTDENTPILPEGTTQRLNEFDRVFIAVESPQGTAQLGDFDLHFLSSEFARLSRKLQGVTLFGALPDPSSTVLAGGDVVVAGATARGIYRSQDIQPIDGVQGPYRLEGKNNERFIIVVPGSETVYVNGVEMTRGASNDYVIDYGLGELTFTSKRLVTDDLRITVEFQYTTNEFTRTLVGSQVDVGLWERDDGDARMTLGATFLREADSREFGQAFDLSAADDSLLAEIGDSTATRSGAERVEFDPEAPYVQYTREPAPMHQPGSADSIFVALDHAPPDSVPVYRVRFSRQGPGRGSYVRAGQTVNGILYEYRGPGQGEYEPVLLLPTPRQQRLVDFRGSLRPVRGVQVFGEWAGSLNDENRLSAVDAFDDRGRAYTGGVRVEPVAVHLGDTEIGRFGGELLRRFTDDHFAAFDRIRPVEYARLWNLDAARIGRAGSAVQDGDEVVDEARLVYRLHANTGLTAEYGRLRLGDAFRGTRRSFVATADQPRLPRGEYRLEYVDSRDTTAGIDGTWLRQFGRLEQPLFASRLVPRVEFEQERRRQRVIGTDSLSAQSLAFVEYRPSLTWRSEKVKLGGSLEWRQEEGLREGRLHDAAYAWTVRSDFELRPSPVFQTEGSVGYRVRRFTETFRREEGQRGRESVVLQWNGRFTPLKRAFDVNWFYEALTERTPTLQEIYIRTGPELGEYVWEDYNQDGIIQLDEFIRESTVDEGTYVRTFIPSDSLASIISVQARATLQLQPARLWRGADGGFRRALANVSARTTVEILEKTRDADLAEIYLLNLSRYRRPGVTLNGRLRIAQDVYLFRNKPRYGLDLAFNQVRSLSDLAAGREQRFVSVARVEGKARPLEAWAVRLAASREINRSTSETFASRSYDIASTNLEPEVSFNPSAELQLSAGVALSQKVDRGARQRSARVWRIPVTARYNSVRKLGVSGTFETAHVSLQGEAVGQTQFELTEGRGPGTSFLWNLSGWYQISRLLRATFSYNGRAPSGAPTIHTVRMQLSAVF